MLQEVNGCIARVAQSFLAVGAALIVAACTSTIEARKVEWNDFKQGKRDRNAVYFALPRSELAFSVPFSYRKRGVSPALYESLLQNCRQQPDKDDYADPYCRVSLQPEIRYLTAHARVSAVPDLERLYKIDLHTNEGLFRSTNFRLLIEKNGIFSGVDAGSADAGPDVVQSVVKGVLDTAVTVATGGVATAFNSRPLSGGGALKSSNFASHFEWENLTSPKPVVLDASEIQKEKVRNPSAYLDAPPQCTCRYLKSVDAQTAGMRQAVNLYEGKIAADIGDSDAEQQANYRLSPTNPRPAPPTAALPLRGPKSGVDGNLQRVRWEYLQAELRQHRALYDTTLRSYAITKIQQEFSSMLDLEPFKPEESGEHCLWVDSIRKLVRAPANGNQGQSDWARFLEASSNALVVARVDNLDRPLECSWTGVEKSGDCLPATAKSPDPKRCEVDSKGALVGGKASVSSALADQPVRLGRESEEPAKPVEGIPYRFPSRANARLCIVQPGRWDAMPDFDMSLRREIAACAKQRILATGSCEGRGGKTAKAVTEADGTIELNWGCACHGLSGKIEKEKDAAKKNELEMAQAMCFEALARASHPKAKADQIDSIRNAGTSFRNQFDNICKTDSQSKEIAWDKSLGERVGLCGQLPLVAVPIFEGEVTVAQFGALLTLPAEFYGKAVNLHMGADGKSGGMREFQLQKSGVFGK